MKVMQWVWIGLGFVLTSMGAILKAVEISQSQAVFEYVFFSGWTYVLLIAGAAVFIVSLGSELVFGPAREEAE